MHIHQTLKECSAQKMGTGNSSLPQATWLASSVGSSGGNPKACICQSQRPPGAAGTAKQRAHVVAQNAEAKNLKH